MPLPTVLPVLRTPRLVLRALVPADADAVFRLFSHPEVMRYWSCAPWTEHAEATRFIEKDAEALAAGTWLRWGWVLSDGDRAGTVIGACGLFALDAENRTAEIGYLLARDAWGHGYAAEGVDAVLRYGFETLGLRRVEADIDPRNAASVRLCERAGFRYEGLLRERWHVNDEVCDTAFYGLLRREWLPQPHGRPPHVRSG
ncbi:MAG: GNAT family N-acetyltransferase [Bacteroidota bacterium]